MSLLARASSGYCRECRTAPSPSRRSPVTITASVGAGGRNLAPDVLGVQDGLNDIEPPEGGPSPKLAVDGICGPLTIGAIATFQRRVLGWADSRIDPTGPTLAALNERRTSVPAVLGLDRQAVGQPPPALPSDQVVKRVLDHVPVARGALYLARSRIESIAPYVTAGGLARPTGPGAERDQYNLSLADECFQLRAYLDPRGVYQRLRYQFENMLQLLRTCDPSRGEVANGLFLRNQSPTMEVSSVGYVIPLGRFLPQETETLDDGTVVSTRRIYITGLARAVYGYRRRFLALISHELAHFASPPGFHVADTLHGHTDVDEEPFRSGVYDRLSNAENYAWFVWRSFEGQFTF